MGWTPDVGLVADHKLIGVKPIDSSRMLNSFFNGSEYMQSNLIAP